MDAEPAGEVEEAPYLPSAEPAGGSPPALFGQLGPVTQPVLAALEWTLGDARRAWRTAIGPGDLLLGLLHERRAASNRVLAALNVEPDELQTLVEQEIERDRPSATLTRPAEAVVGRATEEASRLEEPAVGAEHLLLALAGEQESSVATALGKLGISTDGIRRQVAVLLSPPPGESS
jgi:ATP-dependent Clp protease ATP-binding subunit ClpA